MQKLIQPIKSRALQSLQKLACVGSLCLVSLSAWAGDIDFASPSEPNGWYVNKFELRTNVNNPNISAVRYSADGYIIDSADKSNNWATPQYTFNVLGKRILKAEGLDANGSVIASTSITITIIDLSIESPKNGDVFNSGSVAKVWAAPRVSEVRMFADNVQIASQKQRDANDQFLLLAPNTMKIGVKKLRFDAYAGTTKIDSREISVATSKLSFTTPTDNSQVKMNTPIDLKVVADKNVERVSYLVNGIPIAGGDSYDAASGFAKQVSFTLVGTKKLVARSYSSTNALMAETSVTVTAIDSSATLPTPTPVPPPANASSVKLQVPYENQYGTRREPGRVCNITSISMVLRYLGVNVSSDNIYDRIGGPVFTGNDFVWVFSQYGKKARFSASGSAETIKQYLRNGQPVILQGWFTKSGHVVVITGYDSTGWWINDPAGSWGGSMYNAYTGNANQKGPFHYTYKAIEAVGSPEGPNNYYITVVDQ